MTNPTPHAGLVGGIDSHTDTIHVALIDGLGRDVADHEFATTGTGYRAAVAWLTGHGPVAVVGVEGTSSYGRGVTTALAGAGILVVEVNRTRPAERRRAGKSDRLDAYRAARSVLSGEATTPTKDGSIESLRALMVARRSALKAQQAAWRQIGALLINAPARIRDTHRDLPPARLLATLAGCRPAQVADADHADVLYSLRTLARRHRHLTTEIADLTARIGARAAAANPALLAIKGVGPVIGAQLLLSAGNNPERLRSGPSFAALCGTAPVPVSSGRTDRHRLSRGGDRAANSALHLIVNNRMSNDARTRAYRDTHLARNWTKKDVYRSLKRAVAREIYQALIGRSTVPDYSDLRPARHAKNLTLAAAATDLHVWPTAISQIERGKRRDDQLAQAYREWLNAA
ncbi:IS110 family transposase [Serinicoccus profundi]|uniref:IS110 family transposase n=1 Tax=Serinicoccus profundi TaxID=1078471 RepID=UPI000255E98B|nr:IS110 family transposase [Serinicoccus profundi]